MFQQIAGMPLATALDGNLCILPLEIFRDVKNKPTLSFVRFITWFLHHYFFFVVVTSFTTRKAKMSWKQSILCSPELWEYVVLFLQILIVLKDMEVDVCMWGRYSVNKTSAELPARHQLNYRWFLGLSCFQSYFGKSLLTSTYTTGYQNCFGETSPVFKRSWQKPLWCRSQCWKLQAYLLHNVFGAYLQVAKRKLIEEDRCSALVPRIWHIITLETIRIVQGHPTLPTLWTCEWGILCIGGE